MNKNLNRKYGKNFLSPDLHQAKSGVFSFLVVMVGGGGGLGSELKKKIKVAQNSMKHVLVLEIFKSDEIFKILLVAIYKQPYKHTNPQT